MAEPKSDPAHQMTLRRTFSQASQPAEERVKAAVVHTAFVRGMWGALYGGVIGGASMFFAHKYNVMGMRKALGVSGWTGLVVTAAVAPFWLRGELTIIEGQQHPERFAAAALAPSAAHERGTRTLPLWQRALNHVYDSPFQTWIALVVPAYAAIFTIESRNPATAAMHLSQRIIHTRVIGQFTAISTLVAVGLTTDTMRKAGGRFELPEVEEHERGAPDGAEATVQRYAGAEKLDGVNWALLMPLAYAPLLPLLRIGLRGRLSQRQLDLVTGGTIALALTHAGYIMQQDSSMFG